MPHADQMSQHAGTFLGERATLVNSVLEERSILNSTFQANSAFVGDARPAGGSDSAVHWGACAVRCVAPVQTKLSVLFIPGDSTDKSRNSTDK